MLDQSWKEHLLALDHLRHGIQLRAYGQRDPLNEYKREAFDMFEQMMTRLNEQITQLLAHIEIRQPEPIQPMAGPPPQVPAPQPQPQRMQAAMAGGDGAGSGGDANKVVSRNALCPCGSGKKYKHCHGKIG